MEAHNQQPDARKPAYTSPEVITAMESIRYTFPGTENYVTQLIERGLDVADSLRSLHAGDTLFIPGGRTPEQYMHFREGVLVTITEQLEELASFSPVNNGTTPAFQWRHLFHTESWQRGITTDFKA